MIKKFRFIAFLLLLCMMFSLTSTALSIKEPSFELNVKSAVLMDASTGTILYSKNPNEALPPASVTKIMTLLLVFEAIEKGNLAYDDELVASENAASMGGSQVFLKAGEKMTADELIKCVVVASANDAAVTLAEHVGGTIDDFVKMMNDKAMMLEMKDTHFENVTGLDDTVTTHLTSAHDIAIMSKELIKYNKVSEYATIWMDTIRNGEFGLTNTNRLVRYYKGITGLKTGYTSKSGYCISATAKRDGMELIAVIMGAESSNERNECVSKLLDFGFANYKLYNLDGELLESIKIENGTKDFVKAKYESFTQIENKGLGEIKKEIILNDEIKAPIKEGDVLGTVNYIVDGKIIASKNITSIENINKINYFGFFCKVMKNFL